MRVCASHNQDLPCIQGVHPHPTPRMGPVFPVRRKRTRSSYAVQMGQTSHKGHRCSRGTNTPARPGRRTARPAPQRRSSRTTGTSPGGRRTGGDGAGGARPGGPRHERPVPEGSAPGTPGRGGPRADLKDEGRPEGRGPTSRTKSRPEGRRADLTDEEPTSRAAGRLHGRRADLTSCGPTSQTKSRPHGRRASSRRTSKRTVGRWDCYRPVRPTVRSVTTPRQELLRVGTLNPGALAARRTRELRYAGF
jgi:hypothetical protein